jgi:RNA polymerase sigma-70 factor (ECF subfamily)
MSCEVQTAPAAHVLDRDSLGDHVDALYRAAWALCGSQQDAENLVQDTLLNVLKRPRLLRKDNELGYLLRALRNTYNSRYRVIAQRPVEQELSEEHGLAFDETEVSARELMEAIASAPDHYRDAVIAIDLVGLSYREAARWLGTREATITTRLHRGRQYVARELAVLT